MNLGVKIRNLKVAFKIAGTWHRAMNTDNEYFCFFIRLSHLVSKCWRINKNLPSSQFLFIRRRVGLNN